MKNCDLIYWFIRGANKGKGSNLKIEGDKLINYTTVIAYRVSSDNFLINGDYYSRTTSVVQNSLKKQLEAKGAMFSIYDGEIEFMEDVYKHINE